jgi:hypothetical protein
LPITYTQEKGRRQGQINPEDMQNIAEALDQGKAVVIAAHNPSFNGMLPDKPGYAAVRAAQLAGENTVVIPVAVQVGGSSELLGLGDPKNMLQTRRRRPVAQVFVGESLMFNDPESRQAAERIDAIFAVHQQGQELSEEEKSKVREYREIVDNRDGARLMEALASLMPREKRGKWLAHPSATETK